MANDALSLDHIFVIDNHLEGGFWRYERYGVVRVLAFETEVSAKAYATEANAMLRPEYRRPTPIVCTTFVALAADHRFDQAEVDGRVLIDLKELRAVKETEDAQR